MRPDVPAMAKKMHRPGAAEDDPVPKRTVSEKKASEQRAAAASVDPRQLELTLVDSVERTNGAAADEPQGGAADRARAILASLDRLSSEEVFAAFEELDALPRDAVRAALAASTGPVPDPERLDDALRRAHGFPPRALRLRTTAIVKDADIFDLGSVAEEQVRLAGKSGTAATSPPRSGSTTRSKARSQARSSITSSRRRASRSSTSSATPATPGQSSERGPPSSSARSRTTRSR